MGKALTLFTHCPFTARLGVSLGGGGTLLLESIASAVIGGLSLFGGRGMVIGALVIGALSNGHNLMGVAS